MTNEVTSNVIDLQAVRNQYRDAAARCEREAAKDEYDGRTRAILERYAQTMRARAETLAADDGDGLRAAPWWD